VCLAKYYSDDQIKDDEMGRACGTYGGVGEKNAHSFGADRLDHTGIGGSVIARHVLQNWNMGEWTAFIWLRTGGHKWRAVVSMVINLWVL
jgi:hypothetical protein